MSTLDCPYTACPGCPARNLPYEAQLEAKTARLRGALARYAPLEGLARGIEPIVPAPRIVEYRHRAKLPVVLAGGAVLAGLYTATGRRIVDTPSCPVLHPSVRAVVDGLRGWLAAERLAVPAGPVTGVDVRLVAAASACQVTLAVKGGELPGGARAARRLRRAIPGVATVAVSRADPRGLRVLGEEPVVLAGPQALEERIGESTYRLAPGAFFQVDPLQADELVRRVCEAAGDARRAADIYCGVGTYALALARRAEEVVGIEEAPTAAEAARRAAKDAGLEARVRFVEGRAADLLARGELARMGGQVEAVVLNPARRGAEPAALEAIARAAPRTVVYVSCDPDTLARDLDFLASAGYRPVRAAPVDLFPQTLEVETVVTLERGPRPEPPAAPCTGARGGEVRAVSLPPWASARGHEPAALVGASPVGLQGPSSPGSGEAVLLPPPGASGVAVLAGPRPEAVDAIALVAGRVPERGAGPTGSFERLETFPMPAAGGGLALVRIRLQPDALAGAIRDLARAGTPVIGDPGAGRPAIHRLLERTALVRPFFHVESVRGPGFGAEAPLHGDLGLALERLRETTDSNP